jgi:hypothetical protein
MWTDDEERVTRISSRVAHFTGQVEISEAIRIGMDARREGNEEVATAKLHRAHQLALEAGDLSTAESLAKVIEIDERGTVRLRRRSENVDVDVDAEIVTVRSRRTTHGRQS